MFNHSVTSLGSKSPTSFRVGKQAIYRLSQASWVFNRNELASSSQSGAAGHPGRHDGRTAGHGLEQDQSHSVVAGGNHDNVRSSKFRNGIGAKANQFDSVTEAQVPYLLLDRSPVLAVPYQPKTDRWRAHHGERSYGHVWRTRTAQPPDADYQRGVRSVGNRTLGTEPGNINSVGIHMESSGPRPENTLTVRPLLIRDGHHGRRQREQEPLDPPVCGGHCSPHQP